MCKQEAAGSIPAGSTGEVPANDAFGWKLCFASEMLIQLVIKIGHQIGKLTSSARPRDVWAFHAGDRRFESGWGYSEEPWKDG
jgi:hypothetical protein